MYYHEIDVSRLKERKNENQAILLAANGSETTSAAAK